MSTDIRNVCFLLQQEQAVSYRKLCENSQWLVRTHGWINSLSHKKLWKLFTEDEIYSTKRNLRKSSESLFLYDRVRPD